MPRKLELTWDKTRGRWKKFYLGRQYYFPFGSHKGDQNGYRKAVDAWHKKRAEIDGSTLPAQHHRDYEHAVSRRQELIDWHHANGDHKEAAKYEKEIKELKQADQDVPLRPDDIDPLRMISEAGRLVWQDRLSRLGPKAGITVAHTIDQFLESQKRACDAGQIGQATYSLLTFKVQPFKRFAGSVPVKDVDAKTLAGFHANLLEQIAHKAYSTVYADALMKVAKRIIKWAYVQGIIPELPRTMFDRGAYAIIVDEPEIKTLSVELVNTILGHLSPRFQLYVLLMMNCGFTQKDVANLTWKQVDLEAGTIHRKRTKTSRKKRVPKVRFKLWTRTLKLLKEYKAPTSSQWVLLNNNGQQLVRKYYNAKGKLNEVDNIKKTFGRIMAAKKIDATLKNFRSTSSTLLEDHLQYGRYAQYFLGQAPRSVAEKHYVKPSQGNFDRALKWLGQQYGIVPKASRKPKNAVVGVQKQKAARRTKRAMKPV